jgi:hypothetical protein
VISSTSRKQPALRVLSAAVLVMALASIAVPARAAGLTVVSATPSGTNVSISSDINVSFNQPIKPATFTGTINSIAMVPTQIVVDSSRTSVTIDPGELVYGQTYAVRVDGTVQDDSGGQLGSAYAFSFTIESNPQPKRPRTTVVLPPGPYHPGNAYRITGQATGYVWRRDVNNPLELRHWDQNGNDVGDRPMLHPTAAFFPGGMGGYKYWLYYTPYPPAEDENPNLMRSNDGVNFTAAGVPREPLFKYNYQPPYDMKGLADPEIVKVGDTWMLFYEMEAPRDTATSIGPWMHGGGFIGVAFSQDGLNWTPFGGAYSYDPAHPPTGFPANGNPIIYPESSHYYEDDPSAKIGEPGVLFKDGVYHMWRTAVEFNQDKVYVVHDTATDPRGPWKKRGVAVSFGEWTGWGPHSDVVYDRDRHLFLLLNLIPNGNNRGQLSLRTARSPAGPWKPHPLNPIFRAQGAWEGSHLYRSALVRVHGRWYLYYTGNGLTNDARIGLARETRGVRRVEVSTDGGRSWTRVAVASDGRWAFSWKPTRVGIYKINVRVTDDFMRTQRTRSVRVCSLAGTARNDTLTGTSDGDVICGLAGRDLIRGRGGTDQIYGGRGNDRLSGGPGEDYLDGGSGKDVCRGGPDFDRYNRCP